MSLFHSFPYTDTSTAFDSPSTLSSMSPFAGSECAAGVSVSTAVDLVDSIDPLSTIDFAAISAHNNLSTHHNSHHNPHHSHHTPTNHYHNSNHTSNPAPPPSTTSTSSSDYVLFDTDRLLHLPVPGSSMSSTSATSTLANSSSSSQYSPLSPPDWPVDRLFSATPVVPSPSCSINSSPNSCTAVDSPPLPSTLTSSTASVIVPNHVSQSAHGQRSMAANLPTTTTSSTVSTIVMQPSNGTVRQTGPSTVNGSDGTNLPPVQHRQQQQQQQQQQQPQQQQQQSQQLCKVCGDNALGKNFGVVTCGSCKIFFRRNNPADKSKLQCRNNNRCTISKSNRRNCAACRLRKCTELGMKVKQSKQSKIRNSQDASDGAGHQRHHSQSSNSDDDDDGGYEDLPSLIPVEEVEARLAARLDRQPSHADNTSLDLLDEVILDDITAEQLAAIEESGCLQQQQQENLAPVIEILDSSELNLTENSVELFDACANLFSPEDIGQLVGTSSTTDTIVPMEAATNQDLCLDPLVTLRPPSSIESPSIVQTNNDSLTVPSHTTSDLIFDELVSNQLINAYEEVREQIDNGLQVETTEMSLDGQQQQQQEQQQQQQLSPIVEAIEPSYYESSTNTTGVQSVPVEQSVCSNGSDDSTAVVSFCGTDAIDFDSPECIERGRQQRLMQFYQEQATPHESIFGCGYQNFSGLLRDAQPIVTDGFNRYYAYRQEHEDSVASEDEFYINTDGSCHRRPSPQSSTTAVAVAIANPAVGQKRQHDAEPGLELVKTEAKNLGSVVHMQINELCRLTSLIRIKLGLEYEPNDPEYRLYHKEEDLIKQMNVACRMIDQKPGGGDQCTHVYNSLRQGIFFANKTFKTFEEFWLQNSEMRELIRQDQTGFDRKKNILLHKLYHLRGVYNFNEKENAWAVFDGKNENSFSYIKLTMFNESIKKEMSYLHHQYIHSFPDEWRQDPTIFNMMTFLLIFGAFEEMHSQFKSEKLRYFKPLYLVKRYLESKYGNKEMALQMLHWMLKLIGDLSPLCSECLNTCTHSLTPQVLKEVGPNYAACLMNEIKQTKLEEEERRKRKHTRHSECGTDDFTVPRLPSESVPPYHSRRHSVQTPGQMHLH